MVLGALINHPERLNRETLYELRGIVARYPYFQTARLLTQDPLRKETVFVDVGSVSPVRRDLLPLR